jgi:DnaJ domain
MPTVVIENISSMGLLESDTNIIVLLDGEKKLKFSRDKKVEFLVEDGTHTLQVRVGGVQSLPTTFRAEKGDVIGFECSSSGMWQKQVVLTPLFHNRPHNRFDIEKNQVRRQESDAEITKKGEQLHWSKILNVSREATLKEIETAYQRLMKDYAPERMADVAYEDSEAMEHKGRLINDAYEAARNEKQP